MSLLLKAENVGQVYHVWKGIVLCRGKDRESPGTVRLGVVVGCNQGGFVTGTKCAGGSIGDEEGLDIIRGFIIQGMVGKQHYLVSDSGAYRKSVRGP